MKNMQSGWLIALVGGLVAFGGQSELRAGKPAPPPPPVPAGKIVFGYSGQFFEMKGDGTGRTAIPFTGISNAEAFTPSVKNYGGGRWWLTSQVSPPEYSTYGCVCATKDGVNLIPLVVGGIRDNGDGTNTVFKLAGRPPAWSGDGLDSFCSVSALRYLQDQATGETYGNQRGIFRVAVSATDLENSTPGQIPPRFYGDAGLTPWVVSYRPAGLLSVGDKGHSWSPDGNFVAFSGYFSVNEGGSDLYVANVTTAAENGPVDVQDTSKVFKIYENAGTSGVGALEWTPPGAAQQRLAFAANGHLYVINFDGTGMTDLVSSAVYDFLGIAWSRDGNYLIYPAYISKGNPFAPYQYQISRVKLADRSTVLLTTDTEGGSGRKYIFGWCE
jgi:hypothetical protein